MLAILACPNVVHEGFLGTPLVPFFPFYIGVFLLKLNSRKKGTLIIIKGLLGNLGLGFGGLGEKHLRGQAEGL